MKKIIKILFIIYIFFISSCFSQEYKFYSFGDYFFDLNTYKYDNLSDTHKVDVYYDITYGGHGDFAQDSLINKEIYYLIFSLEYNKKIKVPKLEYKGYVVAQIVQCVGSWAFQKSKIIHNSDKSLIPDTKDDELSLRMSMGTDNRLNYEYIGEQIDEISKLDLNDESLYDDSLDSIYYYNFYNSSSIPCMKGVLCDEKMIDENTPILKPISFGKKLYKFEIQKAIKKNTKIAAKNAKKFFNDAMLFHESFFKDFNSHYYKDAYDDSIKDCLEKLKNEELNLYLKLAKITNKYSKIDDKIPDKNDPVAVMAVIIPYFKQLNIDYSMLDEFSKDVEIKHNLVREKLLEVRYSPNKNFIRIYSPNVKKKVFH